MKGLSDKLSWLLDVFGGPFLCAVAVAKSRKDNRGIKTETNKENDVFSIQTENMGQNSY